MTAEKRTGHSESEAVARARTKAPCKSVRRRVLNRQQGVFGDRNGEGENAVGYTEQLRWLTIHDIRFLENAGMTGAENSSLDPNHWPSPGSLG